MNEEYYMININVDESIIELEIILSDKGYELYPDDMVDIDNVLYIAKKDLPIIKNDEYDYVIDVRIIPILKNVSSRYEAQLNFILDLNILINSQSLNFDNFDNFKETILKLSSNDERRYKHLNNQLKKIKTSINVEVTALNKAYKEIIEIY